MASLATLPTELIVQIVALLQSFNEHEPLVGGNAAWTSVSKFLENQPPLPLPDIYDQVITMDEEDEGQEAKPCKDAPVEEKGAGDVQNKESRSWEMSPLKALRLTDRYFNQIASPFLFRSLRLLFFQSALRYDSLLKNVIQPHWQHIHTLRTYVDGWYVAEDMEDRRLAGIVLFLRECKNLRSLGLYYYYPRTDFSPYLNEVIRLLEDGALEDVGLYSMTVLDATQPLGYLAHSAVDGVMAFIKGIAAHPKAAQALRRLDIASESMDGETYAIIKGKGFPNITSLTVRHSFRRHLWEDNIKTRISWIAKTKLKRLQLINCQTGYAAEIPLIVAHLEALEELTISTCGWDGDTIPPKREHGWSTVSGALCRSRKPLRWFKVEHMCQWEMEELGVIPTTELVMIHWNGTDLTKALKADEELFPGLKLLRMHPRWDDDEEGKTDPQEKRTYDDVLVGICTKRGIELRRDAERMMVCYCCSFGDDDIDSAFL